MKGNSTLLNKLVEKVVLKRWNAASNRHVSISVLGLLMAFSLISFFQQTVATTIAEPSLAEEQPPAELTMLSAEEGQQCHEIMLVESADEAMLEFDAFDTATGSLAAVEINVASILLADINMDSINGSECRLFFNAELLYNPLSGSTLTDTLPVRLEYRRQMTVGEIMTQSGFNVSMEEYTESHHTITNALNPFQGQGKVQIPVKASNLVNFQNGDTSISTNLKAKICLTYTKE